MFKLAGFEPISLRRRMEGRYGIITWPPTYPMAYYPQLYTDIAVMLWAEPNTQRTVTEFLKNAKHSGYLNRVMFGSDQMKWPYAIGKSVDFLNSLQFLTQKDKEDIFYNNAAIFLQLKK